MVQQPAYRGSSKSGHHVGGSGPPDPQGSPPNYGCNDLRLLAYLRFHGRNGDTWWGSDSASRYDYLYSEIELESFVQRIRALSGRSERIFVYFNNHRRGQAVQNGLRLVEMLKNEELVP